MLVLTTPTERFENLHGYPFSTHYIEVADGLKMHYLDEGPKDGPLVLLLHGEPSWSYIYRKMIPVLTKGGCRAIAPDLIGFGKSDKPIEKNSYTYKSHMDWVRSFITQLDLRHITLFCQDWGGLIGLRLAIEMEDRFDRLIAANTFIPTGERPPNEAFLNWKHFSQTVPEFPVGKIINSATVTELSKEVIAAYDAPFPDESYKAGARVFPAIVPIKFDDPEAAACRKAWKELAKWEKPFLTLFSDSDPIMSGGERYFKKLIPGAQDQPHAIIKGGGHFLQEDKGEEIAEHILAWLKN